MPVFNFSDCEARDDLPRVLMGDRDIGFKKTTWEDGSVGITLCVLETPLAPDAKVDPDTPHREVLHLSFKTVEALDKFVIAVNHARPLLRLCSLADAADASLEQMSND